MSEITLPAFCGPINFDMNRDWPCKRLSFAYHLHIFRMDIERTAKYRDRVRSDYKRSNLTNWVADAEERYAKLAVHAEEHPCTCPVPYPVTERPNVPELPACTC